MYALVTGATSGIGREMAKKLHDMGYSIIAVGRRETRLQELKEELGDVITYKCDISIPASCIKLHEDLMNYDIKVFVNNAGFGYLTEFDAASLATSLSMIDTNIKGATILFNLFLDDFKRKNSGYIMNVSSAAAFGIGPDFGVYYASKSYLYKLTLSTYEELRRKKSNVHLSVLCPGPVGTEFDSVASVHFNTHYITSEYCASYALKKMFKLKLIIIPTLRLRLAKFFSRFLSEKKLAKIGYHYQHKKSGK